MVRVPGNLRECFWQNFMHSSQGGVWFEFLGTWQRGQRVWAGAS